MNENDIKDIKNLKLKITKDMQETMIQMLSIKEILDENEVTPKDRKLLEKHFIKLKKHFASEMAKNNPMETIIFRNIMNSKKEIDK